MAADTAEAAAREHAVRALDTKVTGDIAAAERRSDTKLETADIVRAEANLALTFVVRSV